MSSMIDQLDALGKGKVSQPELTPPAPRSYNFQLPDSGAPYATVLADTESKYGLPKGLLPTLIHTESNFNPKAQSKAGAMGIAQIMPNYHPDVDPTDPNASIQYAGKYLRQLYDQLGDWDKAIAGYNTGAGNVKKLWPDKLPKETQDYLSKINQYLAPSRAKGQKSMLDLIDDVGPKVPDAPVNKSMPESREIEKSTVTPNEIRDFYNSSAASPYGTWNPSLSAAMGKMGFGPKPEGGWDEFGRPLNKDGKPYIQDRQINDNRVAKIVGETLSGLKDLVTDPYETARGIIDFGLSVPAFMVGLVGAAGRGGKELIDQVALNKEFNMNDVYNAASKGMQESFEFFQPGKEALIGKPTQKSQRVGEIAMAPLTAMSQMGNAVASADMFKDSPNIQGVARFAGDVFGMITMGMILRGRQPRKKFAEDVEDITKEANDLVKEAAEVENLPDSIEKMVAQKALDVKKQRLENKANQFAKSLGDDMTVVEEMARQTEEIAKAKLRPVQDTGIPKFADEKTQFDYEFTSKKGNKYFKSGDTWYDENGVEVTNKFKKGALEKNKKPFGEVKEEPKPKEAKKKVEPKPEPKAKNEIDYKSVKGELGPIFDFIGHSELKRKRNFFINEYVLSEGEKGKVPPTWHDGAYRYTVFINEKGEMVMGASGSYDTILNTGAARGGEGALPPGTTAYIVDIGPGAVRSVRIYRAPKDVSPKAKQIAEPRPAIDWFGESDRTIEVDRDTGAKVPELDEPISAFMQDKKRTNALAKIFREKGKQVASDPEIYVQKLINDVNRWLHGDENVDIDGVREKLSEMAARSDQLRDAFINGKDHLMFKENASEAASWARKANRGGVRLNMMIPMDEVPYFVKSALKKLFPNAKNFRAGDLFRNKELFDRSGGFWLGKDLKWRYELDDSRAEISLDKVYENVKVDDILKSNKVETTIGNILEHDSLYRLYPELKDKKLVLDPDLNVAGAFKADGSFVIKEGLSTNDMKYVLLHEIQHYANRKAGAFPGSNEMLEAAKVIADRLEVIATDDRLDPSVAEQLRGNAEYLRDTGDYPFFKDVLFPYLKEHRNAFRMAPEHVNTLAFPTGAHGLYSRAPGEMEARLTSFRMNLSSEGRNKYPWESLDNMLPWEGIPKEVGNKLYSGDPAVEAAQRAIIKGAKKVGAYMEKARGMKGFKPLDAAKLVREEFTRAFIDRSGNIRRQLLDKLGDQGYEIIQKMYLSKGASSLAASMLKQMRKEVYQGLSKAEKNILDTLILSERMIDIGKYKGPKEFKHPGGLSLEDFIRYDAVFDKINGMSSARAAEIRARAEAYFEWMKKPLKDMRDSGLISDQEYADLTSHNYRRIEKVHKIFDRQRVVKVGGKKRTVYDSGIEHLQRGKETDIYEPSSEIMALEVFNRAYGRLLNNEANKSLLNLARNDTSNPFVRIKSKESKVPAGWNKVFVFEDGQRKPIYLEPEFSKEWIITSPEMTYRLSQLLRYASGSPVLRMFATGINWGFALANLPRDVMHTWFAARVYEDGRWKPVYNPNLPIFLTQMGRDLSTVFYDAATKGKRYENYIREGGGMEFLVHQGRLFQRGRHLESGVDKLFNVLGYFGETSEIMTRLAIRERVIRRRARDYGITVEEARGRSEITREATFAARDYMDFGQGGGISKAIDNGIPYLNAAIQGTRGLYRSLKPGSGTALSSTYKLAQFAALTTGLYIAATKINPKTMQNLRGDVDMQNNICIPLGDDFGFEDENGQMRYPYIKIPLDPSQKFFKTFFQASADKWLGNPVDIDSVIDTLNEQSPVKVTESLPPSVSGALGYVTNKDFWLNEDIWRQTQKPLEYPMSKEEYIPGRTPQFYIDMGNFTGLSPERTKYAVEELVTSGTIWSYLAGKGYDELFHDLPKSKKEQHLAMALSEIPIAKRFIGVTNPYSKYAEDINKVEQETVLKNFVENRGMDRLVEQYLYEGTATRAEVIKYAASFKDKDTYDRLIDRFKFEEGIQKLPEKSFWRRMKGLNLDARAEIFVKRLRDSTPEEKQQLWEEYAIVSQSKGIISKDFRAKVLELL